mmetsp:Transcript_44367/g.79606  ORF Transcript_44367/g.79606 Transcript_44367/m.79606 type:complete len:244 (-) Transcript_44367:1827-2558(-)
MPAAAVVAHNTDSGRRTWADTQDIPAEDPLLLPLHRAWHPWAALVQAWLQLAPLGEFRAVHRRVHPEPDPALEGGQHASTRRPLAPASTAIQAAAEGDVAVVHAVRVVRNIPPSRDSPAEDHLHLLLHLAWHPWADSRDTPPWEDTLGNPGAYLGAILLVADDEADHHARPASLRRGRDSWAYWNRACSCRIPPVVAPEDRRQGRPPVEAFPHGVSLHRTNCAAAHHPAAFLSGNSPPVVPPS